MKKYLFVLSVFLFAGCITTTPPASSEPLSSAPGPSAFFSADLPEDFYTYEQILREYDDEGRMIKKTVMYDEGSLSGEIFTYEYDSSGKCIRENKYSKGELDDYTLCEYDKKGRLIKEKEYGSSGKFKNYKTYDYLDDGKTIIEKRIKADGLLYMYKVKKYDPMGRILEKSEYKLK